MNRKQAPAGVVDKPEGGPSGVGCFTNYGLPSYSFETTGVSNARINGGRMKFESINFKDKFSKFDQHWSPRVIAEMNDYQFKLVKAEGEFLWHDHPDTDEVFIVVEGVLNIEFRDGVVIIKPGEMFVVPRGVEHKPIANNECKILIVEPKGVVNTGDYGSELTAKNDVWV